MAARTEPGGVVALCGGVGGAKLAHGLARVVPAGTLSLIVNTGDDFAHLGLHVSPDLDTVTYTLAGLADKRRGWGRAGEGWRFMAALEALGGPAWFRLGDGDLALHVWRTHRLRGGATLSEVTAEVTERLGVGARLLPMSDDAVRTVVETDAGPLAFQDYFVRRACAPRVSGFRFRGAETARPAPGVLAALADHGLRAVVICPSNPFLSVDPILAVPGMRAAVRATAAPVVAVSPIVGGRALKGPAAKIMGELGLAVSAATVAEHYAGLIDGFVVDSADADAVLGLPAIALPTVMRTARDRARLARAVLRFAARLPRRRAAA